MHVIMSQKSDPQGLGDDGMPGQQDTRIIAHNSQLGLVIVAQSINPAGVDEGLAPTEHNCQAEDSEVKDSES